MTIIINILLFIVILGFIVFIHEFGHFITAKMNGVYVHEFSLGFGPKLFSFRRKNDETEYMVKLFPLGGYVMLAGEVVDALSVICHEDSAFYIGQKLTTKLKDISHIDVLLQFHTLILI